MRHIGADHGCDFAIHESRPCEGASGEGRWNEVAEPTYLLSQVPCGAARCCKHMKMRAYYAEFGEGAGTCVLDSRRETAARSWMVLKPCGRLPKLAHLLRLQLRRRLQRASWRVGLRTGAHGSGGIRDRGRPYPGRRAEGPSEGLRPGGGR